jgi:pantoate--beta-alanine ligase
MGGKGETRSAPIKKAIEELVRSHPYTQIDYISLCNPVTLDDVDPLAGETLLALAVRVGKTRLIDNGVLGKA